MKAAVYYNEIDPYCAAWLQNLMDAGHIAPGVIDTRSIEDVRPDELAGYTQCHFFAGIGVWSLALRAAGWPDSRRAWTGSCPCQPFSAAGKGAGFADERHLWPAWQHLINQRRPAVVFGEQVASKAVEPWIDLVHADLEGMGYAFGCVPFPSAGVGAPHIRDRSYWVADSNGWNPSAERQQRSREQRQQPQDGGAGGMANANRPGSQPGQPAASTAGHRHATVADGDIRGLAHANGGQQQGVAVLRGNERNGQDAGWPQGGRGTAARGESFWMGDADRATGERRAGGVSGAQAAIDCARELYGREHHRSANASESLVERASPLHGFWRSADWLGCTDGKWRPVEPGTFPLAHGATSRVGRLRAYGNAINAEAAKAFIESYCEARELIERRAAA